MVYVVGKTFSKINVCGSCGQEFKVEKLDNVWQIILECLKTSLRAFKVNNLARSFLPRMCN